MSSTNVMPDLQGVSLLILDNQISSLRELKHTLSGMGAKVHLANDIESAEELLKEELVHVILAEAHLRQGNLFNLFINYKKRYSDGLFFLMAGRELLESSLMSLKSVVNGSFSKPIDLEEFGLAIQKFMPKRTTTVSRLDPLTELLRPYLVFQSPVMRQGLMILPKVAASIHSVLITGETGTGKEMVARAIHGLSPVSNGPFVAINCGAIPETLIEGELFGHEKGAFTGAQATRKGKFEMAQNGTIFLDELGEMPLALQARLLRVLEERRFYRVGGEKTVSINVRVVAATQVDLEKSVENGLFREDLYYRLNVLRIHIPPLRDRLDDVSLLSWHFLERAFAEIGRPKPYPNLSPETIEILKQQPWKGNVRELRNIITRLAVLLPNNAEEIVPEFLEVYFPEKALMQEHPFRQDTDFSPKPVFQPDNVFHRPPPLSDTRSALSASDHVSEYYERDENIIEVPAFQERERDGVFISAGSTMKEAEDKIIRMTLDHTNGNRTKAAKVLGIGLRTIRRKLNETSSSEEE